MAKQRNSLGMLILPVITENMTFAEYEQKFGIDLSTIFKISDDGSTVIVDSSKLILLDIFPTTGKSIYPKYQVPLITQPVVDGKSLIGLWYVIMTTTGNFTFNSASGILPNPFTKQVSVIEY